MSASGSRRKKRSLREESAARRQKQETYENVSVLGFLLRVALMFAVFFVAFLIISHSSFKVERFDITGNALVSDADIISLSGISKDDGLFQSDVDAAEDQIKLHVMIDDVNVRIRPFHTILIEVTEKDAVAVFAAQDSYFYVDANEVVVGELDEPDEAFPLISGFEMPEFVSIGLQMSGTTLDNELTIAQAVKDHFKGYAVEITEAEKNVNVIKLNGIEVRLGSMGRLEEKMDALENLIHTISVQKLESLDYIELSIPDEPVLKERPLGDTGERTEEEDEEEESEE